MTTKSLLQTILLLTALISTTAASPLHPRQASTQAATPWQVTLYQTGCSPGGCSYGFNISGVQTSPSGPSFDTYCSGVERVVDTTGAGVFTACTDTSVGSTQTYNATSREIVIGVKHSWNYANISYAVFGESPYFSVDGSKPTAFLVTPDLVEEVA